MQAIIYTTPTCKYCKEVKELLRNHNITIVEHDVQGDLAKRAEMVQKAKMMAVPVVDMDGRVFVGLDAILGHLEGIQK